MTIDLLADWWVHDLSVERYAGESSYEPTYDAPETITGFYRDGSKLVVGPNGQQVTAAGLFAFPSSVAFVPLQSRVTLPLSFGHMPGDPSAPRVHTVISTARGDGGGQPTPDHQQIAIQ